MLGAVVLAAVLLGCGPFRPGSSSTATAPAPAPADDDDRIAWATGEEYFIVVRKECRTLDVYHYGERIQSHPAVFGLRNGTKLHEGDLRTPTGLYMIADKRRHPRWQRFLLLDYPNLQDLHRYWLAMESGDLPRRGDTYAGVGGAVGIHGTDNPSLNQRGVDWTWGCISLENDAIDEVAAVVPEGTLVLIQD
jgi:murein L,D-transpeptidase YafK